MISGERPFVSNRTAFLTALAWPATIAVLVASPAVIRMLWNFVNRSGDAPVSTESHFLLAVNPATLMVLMFMPPILFLCGFFGGRALLRWRER